MRSDAIRPRKWVLLLCELRAPFFTASAVPVMLGTALAFYDTGTCDWVLFGLALAGVVLIHGGSNVANDYFDHRSGNDEANTEYVRPFTGGSRMIQRGLLTPGEVLGLAVACFALALMPGAYLTYRGGWPIPALAAIGALGGFFYSAPPVSLAARGLGEGVVALNFGVLPVVGAYFLQTGRISWDAAAFSLPVAVLVLAILFINQFQDMNADRAVGKRNWVVRLGRRASSRIYAVLLVAWAVPILWGAAAGRLPLHTLLAVMPLALAVPAIARTWRAYDEPARLAPANALTVLVHLSAGVLFTAGLVWAGRGGGQT